MVEDKQFKPCIQANQTNQPTLPKRISENLSCFNYFAEHKTISKDSIARFPAPDFGPLSNQWKDKTNASTLTESFYKEIPTNILDQIRELYSIDFEMFEYDKYLPFETNKETGDRS